MSYRFVEEREPTDEELLHLMEQAYQIAKQKRQKAYQKYMNDIHIKIQEIKKKKCSEA